LFAVTVQDAGHAGVGDVRVALGVHGNGLAIAVVAGAAQRAAHEFFRVEHVGVIRRAVQLVQLEGAAGVAEAVVQGEAVGPQGAVVVVVVDVVRVGAERVPGLGQEQIAVADAARGDVRSMPAWPAKLVAIAMVSTLPTRVMVAPWMS
jgi:hypothetical protein